MSAWRRWWKTNPGTSAAPRNAAVTRPRTAPALQTIIPIWSVMPECWSAGRWRRRAERHTRRGEAAPLWARSGQGHSEQSADGEGDRRGGRSDRELPEAGARGGLPGDERDQRSDTEKGSATDQRGGDDGGRSARERERNEGHEGAHREHRERRSRGHVRRPAELTRIDRELLSGKRLERTVALHDLSGERARLRLGRALRLVDERELLLLFLGCRDELLALDGDLPRVELARALHREPLAERHRERSRQKARQSRDRDRARITTRAGNPHHQAEVRHKPVVDAEHGGPKRVAAGRTVP